MLSLNGWLGDSRFGTAVVTKQPEKGDRFYGGKLSHFNSKLWSFRAISRGFPHHGPTYRPVSLFQGKQTFNVTASLDLLNYEFQKTAPVASLC
jgi:hypothetical protein